ncbi:MAG TPA: outer membrane beta-barrel protein [Bacteroidales bacterium]|nr:outer membrane beta-barrel protein [Bacteroidales bacterium]
MKKSIIVLFIAFISINAFSQSQGSLVVGGAFSLTMEKNKTEQGSNTTDGTSYTNFKFTPDLEYFLSESLSAGAGIGYSLEKTNWNNSNDHVEKTGMFYLAPYLKKYFAVGDRAAFFGKAQLLFGFGKETDEQKVGGVTVSTDTKLRNFSIGITPGFKYDISNKVALEAEVGFVGFNQEVRKWDSGNDEVKQIKNTFEFSFVPNYFGLGIRYTLK